MSNLDGNGPVATFLLICLGIAWVALAVGIVIYMLRHKKAQQIAMQSSWSWTIPDSPHTNQVPMAPGRWTITPAEGVIMWRCIGVEFQEATTDEVELAEGEGLDSEEE